MSEYKEVISEEEEAVIPLMLEKSGVIDVMPFTEFRTAALAEVSFVETVNLFVEVLVELFVCIAAKLAAVV